MLPVARATGCATGGERLAEAYITSAWNGLSEKEREQAEERYRRDTGEIQGLMPLSYISLKCVRPMRFGRPF